MARPIPCRVSRVQLDIDKMAQLASRGTGNNGKLASEGESHDVWWWLCWLVVKYIKTG